MTYAHDTIDVRILNTFVVRISSCRRRSPVASIDTLPLPISSIEGAILIEPDATCHAIGVILDGFASANGNPARGARYNSAVRHKEYSQQRQCSCLVLVRSEDGTVDLF
jgi:hypothetical protein